MEEKKSSKAGIIFAVIAGIVLIAVIFFTLNYFGVFSKFGKKKEATTAGKTQSIPININDAAVMDARVLYTFQGTIDKITKVPGGYSVVFKNNPKEYFMPNDLNVMQMKSSGQTQAKPATLKQGDAVTFTSTYNLKTQNWVTTYTPQDLQMLQNSR